MTVSARKERAGRTPGDPRTFLSDVSALRRRARQEIEDGAVTPGYRGDRDAMLRILNVALATEIVCVLRYKRHYFMADGIHADPVKAEFLEHAKEEQAHADALCERSGSSAASPTSTRRLSSRRATRSTRRGRRSPR